MTLTAHYMSMYKYHILLHLSFYKKLIVIIIDCIRYQLILRGYLNKAVIKPLEDILKFVARLIKQTP